MSFQFYLNQYELKAAYFSSNLEGYIYIYYLIWPLFTKCRYKQEGDIQVTEMFQSFEAIWYPKEFRNFK